ncbi:hypothetical protein CLAIMM_14716 [Cladophialophora immunda]|nr:hypothetical protein CLAIMM_14716 [Cladophialophora immunda]
MMGRGERSITLEGKWTPTPTPISTEINSENQLRESTPKPTLTTPTPTPTLTPKLYMLGLAFGPLNMAPLSELIGRRRSSSTFPVARLSSKGAEAPDERVQIDHGARLNHQKGMAHSSFLYSRAGGSILPALGVGEQALEERGLRSIQSLQHVLRSPAKSPGTHLGQEARKLGVEFPFYTEFVSLEQHADYVKTKKGHGFRGHDDRKFPRHDRRHPSDRQQQLHQQLPPRERRPDRLRSPTSKKMKETKSRPTLPPESAESESIYLRKPGNEFVVGAGTCGKVFKAIHIYTKDKVALKKIRMRYRGRLQEGEDVADPVAVKILSMFHWTINN